MALHDSVSLAENPCNGRCTSSQWGDYVCKGCGRTDAQIRDWPSYTDVEKKLIVIELCALGYPIKHKQAFAK